MPRRRRVKGPEPAGGEPPDATAGPGPRPGLPAQESVVGETEFRSPGGSRYRILHTDQVDPGDEPKPPEGRGKAPRRRRKGGGTGP